MDERLARPLADYLSRQASQRALSPHTISAYRRDLEKLARFLGDCGLHEWRSLDQYLLEEFVGRVFHVHGKDCEVLTENLYEYGSEQTPVFGKPREFGWITWRYCIPGHGNFRWTRALELLASHQYRGAISVELEDENFNGSERGEQEGLIAASHFLRIC